MDFEEFWVTKKRLIIGGVIIVNLMLLGLLFILHLSPKDKAEDVDFLQSTNSSSINKEKEEISKASDYASSKIYVDVKGAVNKPGMYCLANGKRVNDVIKMAGGLTEQADTKQVNYALKLVDQMVVYVPQIGEVVDNNVSTTNLADQQTEKKVNLNTATLEELQTLTGIGLKKAQKIIDYRQANGSFVKIDDLQNVDGFGAKTVEKLKDSLTV